MDSLKLLIRRSRVQVPAPSIRNPFIATSYERVFSWSGDTEFHRIRQFDTDYHRFRVMNRVSKSATKEVADVAL